VRPLIAKPLLLGLAPWLALGGIAGAATTREDLTGPITTFIDAFDKGDAKTAGATHLPDVTIIDEVPPYIWSGPTAFADWARDLAADDAKHGVAGEKVTLGAVVRTEADARRAYVVMAATYGFTDHGKPMHEPARMTFALRKSADGWKIAGWTWTGPHALAGEAPAKH
jgi:ketosteroid isomerase-like protein